jgi:hypothetical protein
VRSWLAGLAALVLAGVACQAAGSEEPYVPPVIPPGTPVVLVGAGDIADCSNDNDEATALLLDSLVQDTLPVVVFTAGDNAYNDGSASQFASCYHPTWGRHKARTRPAPGNHDYRTSGASGYFGYFGGAAGDPSRGYYSFDAGDAHVIMLNSGPTWTPARPRSNGCAPTSRRTRRTAPSPSGITRASTPAPTTATAPARGRCGTPSTTATRTW